MKKLLLFLLVIGFSVSTFAQVAGLKQQAKFKTATAIKQMPVKDQTPVYQGDVNPYVANDRGQDIVIGTTYYDMQSNSSLDHRFYIYDDGTMAATWIFAPDGSFGPERGTGYNYNDGTDWGTFSGVRIDPERTGWPTYQPYGENGEIVCAHTGASGLVFSYRETKGEGEWQSFYLYGPAGTGGLVWPRMITTGENHDVIHVIASLFDETYEGIYSPVLYSKSTDGGETWDPECVILDDLNSDNFKSIGGDNYAWAEPNNGTIAFVVFNGVSDGVIMKSVDDGDSWERITFYESPDPLFDGNSGDLPRCGGGDGYNTIAIDDEGVIHVTFGRQIHIDETPDDHSWSYYIYSDGLVYWNTTMEPLDTAQIRNDIIPEDWSTLPIYQQGQLAAWTQPNGDDTIVGIAPYYGSLTTMPQMIIHDGIVQIIYGGLAVGFANEDYNYRHIMGRYTEMDGNWSEFADYTDDVFHLLSECVYPVVAPHIYQNQVHMIYQTDNLPGNALQPQGGSYPAHENNMVYMPIDLAVGINNQVAEANFEVSQNYPNPATDETMIMVTTETTGQINLTLSNVLGQIVYRTSQNANHMGSNAFRLNVSNLDAGIYFYTIEIGDRSVTKKMIVK
jgi:hypothetical protein